MEAQTKTKIKYISVLLIFTHKRGSKEFNLHWNYYSNINSVYDSKAYTVISRQNI